MGIYDRDYYRGGGGQYGFSPRSPRTVVGLLIVINVAVWLVDGVFFDGQLAKYMATRVGTLTRPWLWWQFLTAGFAHDPEGIGHILGNMLVLFFLGRDVEYLYGPKEFLRFYLVTVVLGNIVWSAANMLTGTPAFVSVLGASGAITGVVVLYALNFPNRTLLLYFVIPMPAWLLGAFVVFYDIYGAMTGGEGNVAYSVHLAGAAFAFIYCQQRWRLSNFGQGLWERLGKVFKPRPRLHVHRPEDDEGPDTPLNQEIDRILEKIGREGESSLTSKERRTLEEASRRFRDKMSGRD